MNIKKILVCYGYPDLNKGDSAITLATIDILKEVWKDTDIDIMIFGDCEFPKTIDVKSFYEKKGFNVICRKRGVVELIMNCTGLNVKRNKCAYDEYGLVVMTGGHFLFSDNSRLINRVRNVIRLLYVYEPLLVKSSSQYKKVILCQSFGPFRHIEDKIIANELAKCDIVVARESLSEKLFNRYVLPQKEVIHSMDLVLMMNMQCENSDSTKQRFVGINLRAVLASGNTPISNEDKLLLEEEIKDFVKYIIEIKREKVVFVSQVRGGDKKSNENDYDVNLRFVDKFFKNNDNVTLADIADLNMEEIIQYYNTHCKCLISTRYHGIIFAIKGAVPVIGINISGMGNKMSGLFKDLELSDYLVEVSSLRKNEIYDKYKQIDSFPAYKNIHKKIMNARCELISCLKKI